MPDSAIPREPESREPLAETDVPIEGKPLNIVSRHEMNRRKLLAAGAASGAMIGLTVAPGARAQDASPEATPSDSHMGHDLTPQHSNTNMGFVNFVPHQIAILRAACNRIIPTDDTGPGAEEAGVVYFIDREVGSHKYYRGRRYVQGPFLNGESNQGDQSLLTLADRFRIGLESLNAYAQANYDGGFADLTEEQQDEILTAMSAGEVTDFGSISIDTSPLNPMATGGQPGVDAQGFFNLLVSYTKAGFFSDPVHGGNRDMVGWKMIGFPGAHLSWFDQIENHNQPFEGDYISLGQYQQQVGGDS